MIGVPSGCSIATRTLPAAGKKPEATGFSLEGHTTAACNGVYRLHSEHKGWPVLKNEHGSYCYRYTPSDKWFLSNELTPDEGRLLTKISILIV